MDALGLISPKDQKLLTTKTREVREPDPTNIYCQKAEAKRLRKQAKNLKLMKK